jgi:hypothetical protein
MLWKKWIVVLLVGFTAGWMFFDGTRALIVGEYVTPTSGEYAGQLGPWANLVRTVGIEPRSALMKSFFVVYGVITLTTLILYLLGNSRARGVLIALCLLGLWYLPVGTVTNMIALTLLIFKRS